jgi:hypothetical protein
MELDRAVMILRALVANSGVLHEEMAMRTIEAALDTPQVYKTVTTAGPLPAQVTQSSVPPSAGAVSVHTDGLAIYCQCGRKVFEMSPGSSITA